MKKVMLTAIAGFTLYPMMVFALGMTSTNYMIEWDSINSGGNDTSTSTNYLLRDTVGQFVSGDSNSSNFRLRAGYRVGDSQDAFLSFAIGTQENATQVAWTAFSNTSTSVTVAATSSFAVGNFIGVVENKGFAQLIAVGQVTDITGGVITVDNWDGEPASLSSSPSGGNDFVYKLNNSQAQFGTMAFSIEGTSLTVTNVVTSAANGYNVSIQASSTFSNGSTSITDVADGSVSSGAEEYGGEFVGSTATSTGADFSFVTSTRTVQQKASEASNDRIGVIYKLSISQITPGGNYSQTLLYRLTANF